MSKSLLSWLTVDQWLPLNALVSTLTCHCGPKLWRKTEKHVKVVMFSQTVNLYRTLSARPWRATSLTCASNSVNGRTCSMVIDGGGGGAGWVGGIKGNNVDRPWKVPLQPLQPRDFDWIQRSTQFSDCPYVGFKGAIFLLVSPVLAVCVVH